MKLEQLPQRGAPQGDYVGTLFLWGFDGDLAGNEARLQGRLPFLRLAEDARVFAARTAHWSIEPLDKVMVFASSEEAERFGTRLEIQETVTVSPGQLVVLLGPAFTRNLRLVDAEVADRIALSDLPETQSGFRLAMLSVEDFESLAQAISSRAKVVFDQEIRASRGEEVSANAAAALAVLRNTGFTLPHDQMIRTLLAERIRLDPDAYRKSLKLGALRLDMTGEALEADVERHLRLLQAAAQVTAESAREESLPDPIRVAALTSITRKAEPISRSTRTSGASDLTLVERIAAGDRDAFEQLFERHAAMVFGSLFRILDHRQDAEDVLQEAFFQLWRSADRYDPGRSTPRAWLLMLARSRALDRLRSRARQRHESDLPTETLSQGLPPVGTERLEVRDRHEHLRLALDRLSPEQRQLIEVTFFEGLTQTQIEGRHAVPTLGEIVHDLDTALEAVRRGIERSALH